MDPLFFLPGIIWVILLNGPSHCEALSLGTTHETMDWSLTYPPLPNTDPSDFIWETVLYNLHTEDGNVLKLTHQSDQLEGQIEVGSPYEADLENGTSRFVFLKTKPDSPPGLAAVVQDDFAPDGYVRYISVKETGGKSFLLAGTRTAFSPVICIDEKYHYHCEDDPLLSVTPKKADNCTYPSAFFLDFGKDMRRLDTEESSTLAFISAPNPSKNSTAFLFRPVVSRAVSVIQNFTILKSPEEILASVRDVKIGVSEVILNQGQGINYLHEISHNYLTTHEALFETFLTLTPGFSLLIEVGVGVDIPGLPSGSSSAEGGFSFQASGRKTGTHTSGSTERLKMTQKINVAAGTKMKCSAFLRLLPKAKTEFLAVAKVHVYWEVFDVETNEVVSKLAPLGVAMVEVGRRVKGWEVVGSEGDGVLVKFKGALTAEHGISTVFKSEPV